MFVFLSLFIEISSPRAASQFCRHIHPLHPAAFPEKSDHPDAEDRQRVSVSPETQNSQGLTGPPHTLLPDARGHGQSQGNYIGYGWREKVDVKKWAKEVIQKNGSDSKIAIFGVSMGGATTMMASGLTMPRQVKAYIEDCGYTNVKDEVEHEAEDLYHLPTFPRFPLVEVLSGITRLRAGYFLGDGSSIRQVAKNKRPMFFIHGEKDTFVPTKMVYDNYQASKGKKELWIVPGAKHAKSFATKPAQYQKKVKAFLNRYL